MKTSTRLLLTATLAIGTIKGCFIHRYHTQLTDIGTSAITSAVSYMDEKIEYATGWANNVTNGKENSTNITDKIRSDYNLKNNETNVPVDVLTRQELPEQYRLNQQQPITLEGITQNNIQELENIVYHK
jgi:hypothetical protein